MAARNAVKMRARDHAKSLPNFREMRTEPATPRNGALSKHLRGVELRCWQIDLKYRFVNAVGSVDLGRYFRSLLFVFSTVPF